MTRPESNLLLSPCKIYVFPSYILIILLFCFLEGNNDGKLLVRDSIGFANDDHAIIIPGQFIASSENIYRWLSVKSISRSG